jgi:hypothetical protein
MLFHLINRNPNKDITLHVSANNPAMVRLLSPSEISKAPDYDPKSYSTIGLVSKRKSSSSASTKTTLTRSRGCRKMRSAYGYAAETSSTRALFASRGASNTVIGADGVGRALGVISDV